MRQQVTAQAACRRQERSEDLPLSLLLFRYLWPFWLFQDASRGDRVARDAAYRHNRGMRIYLPGYLMKWLVSTSLTLAVAQGLESLSSRTNGAPDVFLLMAAGAVVVFVGGLCIMAITAYIYLYLSRHVH